MFLICGRQFTIGYPPDRRRHARASTATFLKQNYQDIPLKPYRSRTPDSIETLPRMLCEIPDGN